MPVSPFHAMYKACMLQSVAFGKDKLIPALASSDMEIYPYQIAAAQFALRSPYLGGVILCDEGSLGKTFEALLVIAEQYFEGKERILIIVPTPLLKQWKDTIGNHFSLPYTVLDSETVFETIISDGQANPFSQDGIVLTTYDFAVQKAEYISRIRWDISVFEEAHRLRKFYTGENKESVILHSSVGDSFKLLLTATPMQNDIMDLYGLIRFINETELPDPDSFYKRYFRKPENYPELSDRISKYCFRTTRAQVANYVTIPNRIPVTLNYDLTPKEEKLYQLLNAYVARPVHLAYPQMEQYDLALMLFRTLSSSTFALSKTLSVALSRLNDDEERVALQEMYDLCESIAENAKAKAFMSCLKTAFVELKKRGANQKALIFTENKSTQKYLCDLLKEKYSVLTYSGDKSRDYSIMTRFREEAQILITTDVAAEGFNLEFCSFVVNYDLPYNVLTIEQRINRCHRQGQQNDVIVLSFLNKDNFADVRMLELINKRTLQFDGIIGLTDHVIGNFDSDIISAFSASRTKEEIRQEFSKLLEENRTDNQAIVSSAENTLFTSFTKSVADNVTITPQYVKDRTAQLNDDLWLITKYFFERKPGFSLNEATRTISCFGIPPKVFTGSKMGRNEYSMSPDYQPRSGRHTLTGSLAKNILKEIFWQGIPDRGMIAVDSDIQKSTIAFYEITVKPKSMFLGGYKYYEFTGITQNGIPLSDEDCRKIMELPVSSFSKEGEQYGERDGISKEKRHETLDDRIDTQKYIEKTVTENDTSVREEIEHIKSETIHKKAELEHGIDDLRIEVQAANSALGSVNTRLEKIAAQKRLTTAERNLKQAEQNLFMDNLRLEQQAEDRIKKLTDKSQYSVTVKRKFIIRVEGK